MKHVYTFFIIIAISLQLNAQYYQSVANEIGNTEVFKIPYFK